MIETLKEIWAYRSMIRSLVHKDLRGRYQASVLGFLWTFIVPLCHCWFTRLCFPRCCLLAMECRIIPCIFCSPDSLALLFILPDKRRQLRGCAAEPGEQDLFPEGSGADCLRDQFLCEHAVL